MAVCSTLCSKCETDHMWHVVYYGAQSERTETENMELFGSYSSPHQLRTLLDRVSQPHLLRHLETYHSLDTCHSPSFTNQRKQIAAQRAVGYSKSNLVGSARQGLCKQTHMYNVPSYSVRTERNCKPQLRSPPGKDLLLSKVRGDFFLN